MKIKLFLVFLLCINLYGENLSEILQALQSSKKILAIKEGANSGVYKAEQFGTQEAPELAMSLSQADEDVESGLEYSFGVSQSLSYPFSAKDSVVESDVKSIKQELKHKLHIISLDTASRYHKACVSKEASDMAKALYEEQQSRFSKLELLYELGEISKKDLLFNKLDLVKLKQKVSSYTMDYLAELGYLQEMIDNLDITKIACDDLEKIKRDIELKNIDQHAELKNIEYKQNSAKKQYGLYDSVFTSLSYEMMYEKELGAKRYTLGVSIPINTLTAKKEKEKSEYLHKSRTLSSQKDHLSSYIMKTSKASQRKIQTISEQYELLNKEILPMSLELKKLSKTALDEGEGTIMEYLDATRSYSENVLEMLQIKQNYYNELFELYKKADLDLGEKS